MDAPPMSSVTGGDQGYPQQQPYSQAPAAYAPAGARASGVAASYPNARALYAFVGQDASELSFAEGEIIAIVAQVRAVVGLCTFSYFWSQNGEWWTGQLRGRTGLLPANYVQMI